MCFRFFLANIDTCSLYDEEFVCDSPGGRVTDGAVSGMMVSSVLRKRRGIRGRLGRWQGRAHCLRTEMIREEPQDLDYVQKGVIIALLHPQPWECIINTFSNADMKGC